MPDIDLIYRDIRAPYWIGGHLKLFHIGIIGDNLKAWGL